MITTESMLLREIAKLRERIAQLEAALLELAEDARRKEAIQDVKDRAGEPIIAELERASNPGNCGVGARELGSQAVIG